MDKKLISSEKKPPEINATHQIGRVSRKNISSMSEEDIVALLFDLETHQIELQMQNDEMKNMQEILLDIRDQYAELYDFAPVGYVTLTLKGKISKSNLTFCEMLGIARYDLHNQELSSFVFKTEQDEYYQFISRIINYDEDNGCELQLQSQQGSRFWVQLTGACFKSPNQDSIQIRLVIININEQKHSRELIRTLTQAIEQSPVSVQITDRNNIIEYVNHSFEQATGYSRNEAIGKNIRLLKSGLTPAPVYIEMWKTLKSGKSWQGELQNRKKNGDIYWAHVHIAPVSNEQGVVSHYIEIDEDIMQRKEHEEIILHQAHYDPLTDLPNRFLILDRLSQLIINANRKKKEAVALLFLDLDNFKNVNDSLGHEVGDKLLIEAARLLRKAVRTGDTIGRLGGDEFIILLEGIRDESDVIPVAENILNNFRKVFTVDAREIVVTTTIGIAVYPYDGGSTSELLSNADSAMYHAKEKGRNSYAFFNHSMTNKVSRRLLVETQLYEALKRDEFYVCYQPLIDIKTRKISGFEALLRWNCKSLGTIEPMEFIPIAEQSGHIVPIGQFVFKQAVSNLARWQKKYQQDFSMAINLSPNQFHDTELVTFISEVIEQFSIVKGTLEMEITEGVLMSGNAIIDSALQSIKQLGIEISMDDFGTGYSSLSYLRLFPFDTLKIDRSFINDMSEDKGDRDLVNAAITLAHTLGLKVIAEGVESREQLALLTRQGCDIVQGYQFSRPLTETGLEALLDSNKTSGFIEQQFLN